MNDLYSSYKTGLAYLLERLGKDHPYYMGALTLQSRLQENIGQTRQYGDTEIRRTGRAEILDSLNQVAMDTLGTSFNDLCAQTASTSAPKHKLPDETQRLDLASTSRGTKVYEDLERLLYASGLQLVERRSDDLILESQDMLGVRIVARFETAPSEKLGSEKVLSFYHVIENLHAHVGCLISYAGYTDEARQTMDSLQRPQLLRLFTHEEFVRYWVDFSPHLDQLSQTWKNTQASRYYLEIHLDHNGKQETLPRLISHLLADRGATAISVLGDWGTGKSVFCQKLAFDVAELYATDQAAYRLPILLNLGNLLDNLDILDATVEEMRAVGVRMNHDLLAELVRQGRLLWILDGLDELGTQLEPLEFRKALRHIHRLAHSGNNKLVLTSRSQFFGDAFDEEQMLRDFEIFKLEEWSDVECGRYLDNRLGHGWQTHFQVPEETESRMLEVFRAIPLCVAMIAEVISECEAEQIPLDTTALFDGFTEIWINKQFERALLRPEDRRQFIEFLAFRMWTEGHLRLSYRELRRAVQERFHLVTADEIERFDADVRTCSFLTRDGQGNYLFTHRSFMEFFMAKYCVRELRSPTGDLLRLAAQLERSMGVVSVTYGEAEPYEGVLFFLLRILTAQDFQDLISLLVHPDPAVRMVAVRVLGGTRRAEFGKFLRCQLGDEEQTLVRRQIYISLGRLGDKSAIDEYVGLLEENQTLRDENKEYTLRYFGGLQTTLEVIAARLRNKNLTHMWPIDVITLEDVGHPQAISVLEDFHPDDPALKLRVDRALMRLRSSALPTAS